MALNVHVRMNHNDQINGKERSKRVNYELSN